jgi:hypothetical protein
MKSEDVITVGDLITFLLQYDPQKRVMVYDNEYGQDNPLQHIDVEVDKIIFYD